MAVGMKDSKVDRVKNDRRTRPGRWILKILLLVIAGIAGLALCELATRFVVPQRPSWLAIYRSHPDLPFYAIQTNARQVVETGETHWTVVTDANGDRISDVDPDAQAADLPTTLCLGDSFSFAHGVDHELSFVGRMQEDRRDGYQYVNASVPGYGPIQYRQVLEYRLDHGQAPKRLLIATYLGNDFFDCVWNKDVPVTDGILNKRSTLLDRLKQNSHLYRLSASVYHQFVSHDSAGRLHERMDNAIEWDKDELKKAEATYREEFQRIAAICKDRRIELAVVILPSREEVARLATPPSYTRPEMSESRQRACELFEDLGIRFVDSTDSLAERPFGDVFFRFDGHLTPLGHEIVDEQIVRVMTTAPKSAARP